jgi:uncharacterized protein
VSDLFDQEPRRPVPPRPPVNTGRARALVITGVVLVVTLLSLSTLATLWTDRLWYQSVGFGQVFSTMLWTRVGLFVVFARNLRPANRVGGGGHNRRK